MRIGIFCIRDVAPGEFLSYDYRFDTKDGNKFICICGSKNCRGTMKGGKKNDQKQEKKSKKQLITEAKQKLAIDKKFLKEYNDGAKVRLNQTGWYQPGSGREGGDTVANGPKQIEKYLVQRGHIFLWRNACVGADFSARHWRWKSRSLSKNESKSNRVNSALLPSVDVISILPKSN